MAAPYATPIPGAAGYGQAALLANTAYGNALARLNQQRQSTLRQYGYSGDVDPRTGTLSNMRVDPGSVGGELQSMLGSQAAEDQAAQYGVQERGLVGGLAHQATTALRQAHGAQASQFGQTLTDALSNDQDQQNQAAQTRDSALWQAEQQAAADAAAADAAGNPVNPADFSNIQVPDYGAPGAAAANPGVKGKTVLWGGKYNTKQQLVKMLMARGIKPATWAKNHAAAAKQIGL